MNLNKVVFRFVSISFSILVILLVLIGFVKIGTYCYDFGYRVFTEAPVDAEPGRDRKSTRLNSSHTDSSRMPSSA